MPGQLGGLDVLVNNAGIYTDHPVTGTTYEEWQAAWQATLGVNLFGAANATWCAVRHMIAGARGGKIVNVGSRGAYPGRAHPPRAYGASKAGLHALGQSLAVALAPHDISVASVAPGYVATDMTAEELGTSQSDAIRAQSPFGRVAAAAEVAAAVVYLASPEAESGERRGARPQRRLVPALSRAGPDQPASARLSPAQPGSGRSAG